MNAACKDDRPAVIRPAGTWRAWHPVARRHIDFGRVGTTSCPGGVPPLGRRFRR